MDFEKLLRELKGALQGLVRQPFGLKPFWGKIALLLSNSANVEVRALAENDGTMKVSNYGKAAGTLTAFKVETTGEQDNVMHGKQSGGTIGALRINANNQLQVEIIKNYQVVDPIIIPTTEGILYSPGSAASEIYEVWVNVVNVDGTTAAAVSLGVDIAAGGSLSGAEYFIRSETVPSIGSLGWRSVIIAGDDDIRGISSVVNIAAAQFRVWRIA